MKTKSNRRGFTLIELLAVVAIILLLLSLLIPALSTVKEKGQRTLCLSNMRQLQTSYNLCAADRGGSLPGSMTGSTNDWVNLSVSGGQDSLQSLMSGALWPYVQSAKSYLCPIHPFNERDGLYRDFSLNNYLNGVNWSYPNIAKTLSAIPRPAGTFAFIEEPDPRKGLQGSWVTDIGSYDKWVDPPAYWHSGGSVYSFVDGHVEFWKSQDARTLVIGTLAWPFYQTTPNNPDLYQIKRHLAPGDTLWTAYNAGIPP